jgi:hypothetical protein
VQLAWSTCKRAFNVPFTHCGVVAGSQEAQEIFGDVSDLLEEYSHRRRQADEDDDMDDDELLEGDEDAEEAEQRQRTQVRASVSRAQLARMLLLTAMC